MQPQRELDERRSLWVGFGLLWGFTIGALLVMIFRDRNKQLAAPSINIWNGGMGGQLGLPAPAVEPQPVTLMATQETAAAAHPSKLETYTLPTRTGARVMTAASDRHWTAQIYNVGPPGSFASIATDPNQLSYPSSSIQIPAGGKAVNVRVRPRDALFAIGNVPNVRLSVVASEDLA